VKRLLVIANLHHASPRIPGLLTSLYELGWEVTIVTPPIGLNAVQALGFPEKFLERVKLIEVPYRGDVFWLLRRVFRRLGYNTAECITEQIKGRVGARYRRSIVDALMKAYQTFFAYPDTERTWRKSAITAALPLAKSGRFDALLSSAPFPTSHVVASYLQRETGLKWIADFRDTWTQNPLYDYPMIRRWFEERLEYRTLRSCSAIVTVSDDYAEQLRQLHKRSIYVIPNGFTFAIDSNVKQTVTQNFTITYTGTIYTEKQDPDKFLSALQCLISENKIDPSKIEVRFYGRKDNWLQACIESRGLERQVRQYGTIARLSAVEKQRESQLLLFFNWEDAKRKGLSHLKLYEYLSANRPILATGGFDKDSTQMILNRTDAGVFAHTVSSIKAALLNAYQQYEQCGRVTYSGRAEAICEYSYSGRAQLLAAVMRDHIEDAGSCVQI
jgi:glycosyltransferase involved in cell wall biosynthesis